MQPLLAQPLASALPRIQRGLLQRLQRGQATIETLQLALCLLLRLTGLLQFLTQLLQALGLLLLGQLQGFVLQLAGSQLFAQFENGGVFRIGGQLLQFFAQATLTLAQALEALLQLGDARLLHLGLATRLGTALVEAVPLLLPTVHGGLGFLQAGGGLLGGGRSHLLLGQEHLQLLAQGGQQGTVVAEVRLGFQARLFRLAQVILQLAQALLAVLDALLDAGDIAAHGIETALHQVETLGQLVMTVAQAFDAGIGTALLGHQGLEGHLLVTDHLLAAADLLVQGLPAQRQQLSLELTLLGLVFLVLLRGLGLPVQALELALQLLAQVGQARQVFLGAADAILGLATALLVLGDAGGFLDEVAQFLGLGLDQLADHALLDD